MIPNVKPQHKDPAKKQKSLFDRKPSDLVVKTKLQNSFDNRWSELKIQGKNIGNRSGHISVVHNNKLYVHGGYDSDKGMMNDFQRIDISETAPRYQWQKLNNTCDGQTIKLKLHTGICEKDCIYLFGGQKNATCTSNTIYIYHINEEKWTKIEPNINIPKIDSHSAASLGGKMYVYGGYIADQAQFMLDIYAFDYETQNWSVIYKGNGNHKLEPEGRSDFNMIASDNCLLLFGGSNGEHTLNDFWKYELSTNKWNLLDTKDTPEVQPRRGHSLICYNNYIFMFGGIEDITKQKNDIYVFQIANLHWKKIHTTTNSIYDCSPTLKKQRKSNSPNKISVYKVQNDREKQADPMQKILFENKQKKFNERKKELLKQFSDKPTDTKKKRSYSPTTESMVKTLQGIGLQETAKNEPHQEVIYDESHKLIIGKKPCARDGQSVCLHENKMVIFGGDRHLMAFNDLYCFDLEKGVKSLQLYKDKKE